MAHRVLLVDDDLNVREGLRRALRKEPYQLDVAPDAAAAFKILDACPADVVIADQEMPGMKGVDFLTKVRISYRDTIRMMLTGQASLDVAVQAINEGQIYRFFTKPANPVDLAVTIRRALQEKDLLMKSRRLLAMVKTQAALLDRLEEVEPGITRVALDTDGCLVLSEEVPEDRDAFLADLQREIDRASSRLRERA